jgi:hypothetical protein
VHRRIKLTLSVAAWRSLLPIDGAHRNSAITDRLDRTGRSGDGWRRGGRLPGRPGRRGRDRIVGWWETAALRSARTRGVAWTAPPATRQQQAGEDGPGGRGSRMRSGWSVGRLVAGWKPSRLRRSPRCWHGLPPIPTPRRRQWRGLAGRFLNRPARRARRRGWGGRMGWRRGRVRWGWSGWAGRSVRSPGWWGCIRGRCAAGSARPRDDGQTQPAPPPAVSSPLTWIRVAGSTSLPCARRPVPRWCPSRAPAVRRWCAVGAPCLPPLGPGRTP